MGLLLCLVEGVFQLGEHPQVWEGAKSRAGRVARPWVRHR